MVGQTFTRNLLKPLETDTLYPKDRNAVTYAGKFYEMKDYGTVIEVESAKPVAFYQRLLQNQPAVTSHEWGEGKAYYIGARLERAFQMILWSVD